MALVTTRPFLPSSNLVCIKEVTIRTTFSYMINIAAIIYYIGSLVIDIHCLDMTGHVLRRLDLASMTHYRSLVRGKCYALISIAQLRKNGYYHLHFDLF